MHYTLLPGHIMFKGTRPFLQSSGVYERLLASSDVYLLSDAVNDMFFVIFPKVSQSCLWRRWSITLVKCALTSRLALRCHGPKSKAVSEGNGSVPQVESGSDEPMMAELYRVLKEGCGRTGSHLEELTGR